MTAITYGTALSGKTAKTATGKSFWARFYNRLVEARMRQAEREIRMHLHLLPTHVEFDGKKFTYKNAGELPFVR